MSSFKREQIEKTVFVVSLAVLVFLYGFATSTFGWFPSIFLERAWLQAHRASAELERKPSFVAERVYDWTGVRGADPDGARGHMTLLSSVWESSDDWIQGVRLIDDEGRTVHEWEIDIPQILDDSLPTEAAGSIRSAEQRPIHGVHLFPGGDVLVNIDYVAAVRLDGCSRVRWVLPAGNHHSIDRADDGSFWIPGSSSEPVRKTSERPGGFPGLDGAVYLDRLLRVSGEGEVLDRINVLDLLYENDLERYIKKARQTGSSDVTHLNDIEQLSSELADEYPLFEAGDLLVSLRNLDLVFVVDPNSEQVKWHASDPFLEQHDPDFIGDGWIGVFDNNRDGTDRGSMLGGSRIVLLQPHSDSRRVRFPTPRPDPFYTPIMGKWQRLENGNLLLTEARAGRVVEVTPDGETVWEWVHAPYDDSHVPEVSEGTRYDLAPDDVASWPCSDQPSGT